MQLELSLQLCSEHIFPETALHIGRSLLKTENDYRSRSSLWSHPRRGRLL
jgi:hypothetical protein